MSNTMPFILSSSPPPIDDCEEEEEDEFGDFRRADHSFSLTDLNQPSDSPGGEKPWIELTVKNNQKDPPSSNSLDLCPNDLSSLATSGCKPESPTLEFVEGFSKTRVGNGITTETNSFFDESDKTGTTVNDAIFQSYDLLETQVNETTASFQPARNNAEVQHKIPETNSETLGVLFPEDFNYAQEGKVEKERTRESEVNGKTCDISAIYVKELEVVSDDFSDFTDFTTGIAVNNINFQTVTNSKELHSSNFSQFQPQDDFDDFETAEFKSCTVNEEPSIEETLKSMFQDPNQGAVDNEMDIAGLTDSLYSCLDDSSSVWGYLKELETSHALSYQWPNSTANKTLLSSLNIDCRNILFGARWNLCVPRFAANLGVNPLEPVKATETASFSHINSTPSTSAVEDVVPAAQFDWNSSGLTNPLDTSHLTLLDLDFFTKFDDISSSSHAASSFWTHSRLEKENPAALASEEPAVPGVVEPQDVGPVKPVVDHIFGSISVNSDGVVGDEERSIPPLVYSPAALQQQKKSELSAEAYAVMESFPDLSFLSARKLMHAAEENMSRWSVRP